MADTTTYKSRTGHRFTVDSLERALVHHGVKFRHVPAGWLVETGLDEEILDTRQAYAFVLGLAAMRRKLESATAR